MSKEEAMQWLEQHHNNFILKGDALHVRGTDMGEGQFIPIVSVTGNFYHTKVIGRELVPDYDSKIELYEKH